MPDIDIAKKALGSFKKGLIQRHKNRVMKEFFDGFTDKIVVQNPKISMPEVKVPDIKVPDVIVPEIKMPNIPKAEVTVDVQLPDIPTPIMPPITVPRPQVTVNVPEVKVPAVNMPDRMEVIGNVGLLGIDRDNPMPMLQVDINGKPVQQMIGGGGGRTMQSKERVSAPKTDGAVEVLTSTTLILDTNQERHTFTLTNDGSEVVYITHGLRATVNSGVRLNPNGGSYTNDVYTGPIAGCTGTTNNNITVLEL